MSRFSQYNKNDTYRDNYNYANFQNERRTNEEMQEIERDRKAMERLQIELDQEKKLEKERKNLIRQQQYEDYSNYMRQKYAETPQNKEKINIKLGGEQRFIRKPSYNQQMDNLCLNPTRQENPYPIEPIQNFSEAGRNYQRGYSHGYNILTGESFSPQQMEKKTPKNISINTNNLDLKRFNIKNERPAKTEYPKENQNNELPNKEKEELKQYQAYMEMKRQKEQEEMYYLEQQEKEKNRQIVNKTIDSQNPQFESQPPQNYNELNQGENYEQMRINPNEIPSEYRDIYMKQQMEQQQKQELQREEKEIPPEYRQIYMEQERQNELQKEQEIPPEYRDILIKQQMEQERLKELQQKQQNISPDHREMYLRELNMKDHQITNVKDENNQIITQQKEMPNEY